MQGREAGYGAGSAEGGPAGICGRPPREELHRELPGFHTSVGPRLSAHSGLRKMLDASTIQGLSLILPEESPSQLFYSEGFSSMPGVWQPELRHPGLPWGFRHSENGFRMLRLQASSSLAPRASQGLRGLTCLGEGQGQSSLAGRVKSQGGRVKSQASASFYGLFCCQKLS